MTNAEVLTRMLHAIDLRDWPALRASLAEEVRIDFTSLWGGAPRTSPADQLVREWAVLIDGFTATQHLTGPVVVTDGRAHTHVRAHHWLGEDTWTVYGHYTARVVAGRIAELTLYTLHEDGNRDLPAMARTRVGG